MAKPDAIFVRGEIPPLRQAVATGEIPPYLLLDIAVGWLDTADNYVNPNDVIRWAEEIAKVADYGFKIFPELSKDW